MNDILGCFGVKNKCYILYIIGRELNEKRILKNIKKSSKKVLTLRVKDGNIYKSLGGTPQEGKNLENKIVPDKK